MVLTDGVSPAQFGSFLLFTTLGNVAGGGVFVGLLNYGHVALAGERQDVEFETRDAER
jgi:formate/nitrite transporter FocA (FNT family)